eukprot:Opistho-1_new@97861
MEKFAQDKVITAIYFDKKGDQYYLKRFVIESQTLKNKYSFIKEGDGNFLKMVTTKAEPVVIIRTGKKKSELAEEIVALHEIADVTGWKTVGTKIAGSELKEVVLVQDGNGGDGDAPTLF